MSRRHTRLLLDEVSLRKLDDSQHRKRGVQMSQGMIHTEQFQVQSMIWHVARRPSGTSPFAKAVMFLHVE